MTHLLDAWRHRSTHRRVWALAAPMMLCNLSVPMVALVDSAVIGHLPHAQDLAAVVIGSTRASEASSSRVMASAAASGWRLTMQFLTSS